MSTPLAVNTGAGTGANLDKFITDATGFMENEQLAQPGYDPYTPSFAGTGSSGMSFGKFQNDVAGQTGAVSTTNKNASQVLTQSLQDYGKANPTAGLTSQVISKIVSSAGTAGISETTFTTQVRQAAGNTTFDAVGIVSKALRQDRALVDLQDQGDQQDVVDAVHKLVNSAQGYANGPGVLDANNPDPAAVAMLAAWANQTKGLDGMISTLPGTLKGPVTLDDIKNYISSQPYFNPNKPSSGAKGDFASWSGSRIPRAVTYAESQQGGQTKIAPLTPPHPLPMADADGDIHNLADVVGGSGAGDPNEANEGDEEITNVGGKPVDLRADTALHSRALNLDPTTVPSLFQTVAAALGLAPTSTAPLTWLGGLTGTMDAFNATNGAYDAITQANLQAAQIDPYDPNYATVYAPVPPAVVSLPVLPSSVPAAIATALQNDMTASLTAMGQAASYANAIYITQNRLYSANNAGDLNSFELQNNALNQYVAAFAQSESTASQAITALVRDLGAQGIDATITADGVASFQANLAANGLAALPAQAQALIKAALPDAGDQQAVINLLLQGNETKVPTSFIADLKAQATAANAVGTGLTLRPLADTTLPNLPSRTVTGAGAHAIARFSGAEAQYALQYTGQGKATVTDGSGNIVVSINNEVLQFADRPYFIESGDGANIARLYSAGLGRVPDPTGLFGWEDIYSNNVSAAAKAQGVYVSLAETSGGFNGGLTIADGIIDSAEFTAKYGSLSNADFVTQLYQNVLARGPDSAGLNGWLGLMSVGDGAGTVYNRGMVLVGFAESAENIAKAGSWMTDMSKSG